MSCWHMRCRISSCPQSPCGCGCMATDPHCAAGICSGDRHAVQSLWSRHVLHTIQPVAHLKEPKLSWPCWLAYWQSPCGAQSWHVAKACPSAAFTAQQDLARSLFHLLSARHVVVTPNLPYPTSCPTAAAGGRARAERAHRGLPGGGWRARAQRRGRAALRARAAARARARVPPAAAPGAPASALASSACTAHAQPFSVMRLLQPFSARPSPASCCTERSPLRGVLRPQRVHTVKSYAHADQRSRAAHRPATGRSWHAGAAPRLERSVAAVARLWEADCHKSVKMAIT